MRVVFLKKKVDRFPSHWATTKPPRRKTMSTSLLYHRFGVVGYRYVRQSFEAGISIFRIEQPRERLRYSQCGSNAAWAQAGGEKKGEKTKGGKQRRSGHFLATGAGPARRPNEVPPKARSRSVPRRHVARPAVRQCG